MNSAEGDSWKKKMTPPARGSVQLQDLTWRELAAQLNDYPVILLPIGAIEAHGPHLPLDTDVLIAQELARRAACSLNELGTPALVAPAIHYSVSFVGGDFPGTLPVTSDALVMYLLDVLQALGRLEPVAIVVVNAHLEPAHVAALHIAIEAAQPSCEASILFPDIREQPWSRMLSDEFWSGRRHAGAYETSLLLAA